MSRAVAVLRPEPGNAATAARIEQVGLTAIRLPLFSVRAVDWVVPDPARFDSLILTSANTPRLAGAGLDTFATEPPDAANPLFALPNVLVTPHIAAATTDAMTRMGTIAASNIISYLRGEVYDKRNFLNPEVFRNH